MYLKLKAGETFTSRYGYTHGDFVAHLTEFTDNSLNETLDVSVSIFKSEADRQNGLAAEDGVPYSISGSQYDTVKTLIESRIRTQGMTHSQAVYNLLLTRPQWVDWELEIV